MITTDHNGTARSHDTYFCPIIARDKVDIGSGCIYGPTTRVAISINCWSLRLTRTSTTTWNIKISNNVIIEDLWEQDLYQNYIKLISLEKNEKCGIIYPDTIDVKNVEKWLKTL